MLLYNHVENQDTKISKVLEFCTITNFIPQPDHDVSYGERCGSVTLLNISSVNGTRFGKRKLVWFYYGKESF